MTNGAAATMMVAAAELKSEWRSPFGFVCAALFSFLVLLTQALAFPTHLAARPEIAFAAFFVSTFFAGLLSENARIGRERKSGTPYLLALSTADAAWMYIGKAAVVFGVLGLIQICLFPFLVLFFNLPFPGPLRAVLLCVEADVALACLLTLFGAAAFSWKGAGTILGLPILILPAALPILAAVSIGASSAWTGQPTVHYLKLLLAADLAIGTVGSLTYGKLLGRI